MPLITTSVPNLTGGVSQQPTAQRLPNQCEAQENALPLLVGGLIKRPPSNHVSEIKTYGTDGTDGVSINLTNPFTHVVNRDDTEQFFVTLGGSDDVYINYLDGSPRKVLENFVASGYLTSSNPSTAFRAVTVGDVTYIVNTEQEVTMSGTAGTSINTHEALIWIKATQTAAEVKIKIDSTEYASGTPGTSDPPPSTTDMATTLAGGAKLGASGTAESSGSVIYFTKAADFQISGSDTMGQNGHVIIKEKVNNFADLPPVAKHGMIVLVEGDPESEVDDYYVKFEVNEDSPTGNPMGNGVWVETAKPGIAVNYNYQRMPHLLVRQTNGEFVITKADGTAPAGEDGSVDFESLKFTPRQVGSDLTNPKPSFVDNKISDVSFFKNRLVFLSGENISLSEAGEYSNFFRTTVTLLPDTAPIDVGAGGTEVSKLETAIPFSDRLMLFSKQTQFAFRGEGILSPLTASITQVTNFDILTDVKPVPAGNTIFFGFNRGSFSGVREYFKTNETDINFDAVEVTSQAPKYIAGDIRKMTVSTMESMLAVLARTKTSGVYNATNEIFVYKYFNGDRGRLQSAWFKFSLSNCEILDIHFIEQSLYMIIKRGSKTFIERMDLQTGLIDEGATYTTHLDRRVKITGDGADPAAAGTVINLPYSINGSDVMQVCDSTGEVRTIASQSGSTVTLTEEFAADEVFYVGIGYTMTYEMSSPVLKRPKEGGGYEMLATGRHQLRYMTVVYDDTAHFLVKVSTPTAGGNYTTPIEYPFSGRFLSAGGYLGAVPSETGDFRFPVFAESDSVKIEIVNDSPLPSNIQSVEFEAYYTSRSQRMQ